MTPDEYIRTGISSPLGDRSLKSRARLFGLAITSIAIVHMNLVPTQIDGLGIKFTDTDQRNLLLLLLLGLCYSIVSFALSGSTDFDLARLKRKAHVETELSKEGFIENSKSTLELRNKFMDVVNPLEISDFFTFRLFIYRFVFDLIIPLTLGIYAIAALIVRIYTANA